MSNPRIIPAVRYAGPGQRGRVPTPLPLRWPNHYPGLDLDYGLDLTDALADTADTVAAVTCTIAGTGLVVDSAAPAANAAGVAAKVAKVQLRGGTEGTAYTATLSVTTAAGLPLSFAVALYCGIAIPGTAPVPEVPLIVPAPGYGGTISFSQGAEPQAGTIVLDGHVAGPRTVTAVHANGGTAGGSIAARVEILRAGVATPIGGLEAVLASGATATFAATGANALIAGDVLQLVITAVTGTPADAWIAIVGTNP